MKNKYNIGETLEDKETDYFGIVEDIEDIYDTTLYYFEDGHALPEERVTLKGVKGMKKLFEFINKPEDEKNRIWNEACEKVGLTDDYISPRHPKWLRKILSYFSRHRR